MLSWKERKKGTRKKRRKKERKNKRNKEHISYKLGYPNYSISFWTGHNGS
jgi:hypothetical protein